MSDATFSTTPKSQRFIMQDDVHCTPDSETGQKKSQLSERGKARVDAAAPNGPRCMITNAPENLSTQYAHIYPRRIMKDNIELLEIVEKNWGIGAKALNLDTRRNVVRLESNLHLLHDNPKIPGSWMLLPEKRTIDRYLKAVKKKVEATSPFKMPDEYKTGRRPIKKTVYMYRLVPVSMEMRFNFIPVQADLISGREPSANDVSVYWFPFEDLPLIRSHLNPRFAILEAGRRLHELSVRVDSLTYTSQYLDQKTFNNIVEIYQAWTTPRGSEGPAAGKESENGNDDQMDEGEDNDSDHQGSGGGGSNSASTSEGTGRRTTRSTGKRKHSGTPSRAGGSQSSQRRRLNPGAQDQDCTCSTSCLSGETLHEHELVTGKRAWDEGQIHTWANTVVEAVSVTEHVPQNIQQF